MRSERGVTWLLNQPARWRAAFSKLAQADFATQQAVLAEIGDRRALIDWFAKSIRIAIVGPPNAGKSTLINLLADQAVSLVSDRAGTTRDWVEAPGELDGFPVVWCDTAGIRASEDPLEAAGIAHGLRVAAGADMTVALCDITAGPAAAEQFLSALADAGTHPTLIVGNKADISGEPKRGPWGLALSAHRSEDRVAFENAVRKRLGRDEAQLSEAAAFTPALVAACEQAASSPERFRMLAESIVNDRDSRPDVLVDDSPPRI
jgi:small GTP-binding protein